METSHTLLNPSPHTGIEAVMRCQDFGSMSKFFRVTTCVLKLVRVLIRVLNKEERSSQIADSHDSTEAKRL